MKKKLSALLAAGMVTFTGASFGAAAPTFAQDPTTTAPASTADLVDPARAVSLTINKKLGDPTDAAAASDLPGVEGVQFKIERIDGVDLTTNAGWQELAGMSATNLNGNSVGYTTTITTDGSGVASINTGTDANFKVGVYRVTEIQKTGYTVAPPFLITLPYSGTGGTWTYDRTVYPKNQSVVPNKQVDDTGATIGTNLAYTINAPVPAGALDRFNIVDELNANLALQTTPAITVTAPDVTFDPAADYTIDTENNTLTVNFTRAGLDKLQAARLTNPALQVSVGFSAQVVSIPDDGTINNTATVQLPNGGTITTDVDANSDGTPDTPTNTVFGTLTINKNASVAGDLSGATFELYQCHQDAGKWVVDGSALTVATSADGPSATTLTTADSDDADTTAAVNGYGVPIQSTAGGATGTVANTYCVLETAAPAGYVRNPEPQPVSVNLEARTLTANVKNEKDSLLGQLPATGAWGIVLIFLIGLGLLARGLYTSYRDNKQEA